MSSFISQSTDLFATSDPTTVSIDSSEARNVDTSNNTSAQVQQDEVDPETRDERTLATLRSDHTRERPRCLAAQNARELVRVLAEDKFDS